MARSPNNEVDVESLSLKELTELLKIIEAAIPERKTSDFVELKRKLAAVATEAGYTLEEVLGRLGGKKGAKAGSVVSVKYRNPDHPAETWSGRGRPARWLADKLKKRGTKREDFAV